MNDEKTKENNNNNNNSERSTKISSSRWTQNRYRIESQTPSPSSSLPFPPTLPSELTSLRDIWKPISLGIIISKMSERKHLYRRLWPWGTGYIHSNLKFKGSKMWQRRSIWSRENPENGHCECSAVSRMPGGQLDTQASGLGDNKEQDRRLRASGGGRDEHEL